MAVRLSRFITIAFSGITTLPNIRNSTTRVIRAMSPTAYGRWPNSESLTSISSAPRPVTSTGAGAGADRTASTRSSPSVDSGSTDGTTDR